MESKISNGYLELSDFLDSYYQSLNLKRDRGVLVFPPSESLEVGRRIFNNLSSKGIATFIVTEGNIWNPKDQYYELIRDAARRGCDITRIFLVPHRYYLKDKLIVEQKKLDEAAGIKIKFVHAGKLLSYKIIPPKYTLDFGIWDDSLVCFVSHQTYAGNIVPSAWTVSKRLEDLEFSRTFLNDLFNNKSLFLDPFEKLRLDLEEPMLKSAPLMSMLSEVMCKGNQVCTEDCSWYHRIWQYLRLFDLVSTPTWHYHFYIRALRDQFQDKKIKVLISGTADYSMLAHVLYAFSGTNTDAEITVLDMCQTPLVMCEWYAIQTDKRINVVQEDLLNYNLKSNFDLIITDAFLTRFPDEDKLKVLKKWYELLKPGGSVITTIRIEEFSGNHVKASDKEVQEFKDKVYRMAQNWNPFLSEPPEEIAIKGGEYAKRMISFSVRNLNDIQNLVSKSGYKILENSLIKVKGEMHNSEYLELIIKK